MAAILIKVENLTKQYRQGFWMRQVEAVGGISLTVKAGTIFGFLGPNGAGKTTTIKVLTGLIQATSGRAEMFGIPVSNARARRKLGYLPENPYVYPYLTPREFVTLGGRLSGLSARAAADRCVRVLEQVGISYAADRPARKLSKGMLQRAGLAAALVADPELLILDEPMSGLDPVGRKEVRDLIVAERAQGRTIFFSSHILTDVESLCDEVTILRRGKVVVRGALSELLRRDAKRTEVVVVDGEARLERYCEGEGISYAGAGRRVRLVVEGEAALQALLAEAVRAKVTVAEVTPQHETLEQLFVREAIEAEEGPSAAAPRATTAE